MRIAGLVFLALMAILALLPGHVKGRYATVGAIHECLHLAVFCLAYLLLIAGSKGSKESAVVSILLAIFGITLELFQTRAYGTNLELHDVAANLGGIIAGYLTRSIWSGRKLDHSGGAACGGNR